MRHSCVCEKSQSILLVIDLQAGLSPVIKEFSDVALQTSKLLEATQLLGIPCLFTEQSPSKLGHTCAKLTPYLTTINCFHKTHFSACMESSFLKLLANTKKTKVVIAGTEAHVCVLQTSLDLIAAGYQVFIVDDAVASRNVKHKELALKQLQAAGAILSSTETVLFQWLERAETDQFRALLPLIK